MSATSYGQIDLIRQLGNDTLFIKAKNELPVVIRLIISDSLNTRMVNLRENSGYAEVLRIPLLPGQDTTGILNKYSFTVRIGNENVQHDDSYRYALPFSKGRAYELIQGFKGSFSHNKDGSRYALDFRMPKGDTVCAARDGLVVWTENGHEDGGNDPELIDDANRVMVIHSDGTLALYTHLLKDGILVSIGDRVNRGQPLGLSGNSGFSTTPHLHFAILVNNKSVPFRFKRQPRNLKKGEIYRNKK